MKLSKEQLSEVTEYGKLQFTAGEIAVILDVDIKQFTEECIINTGSDINKAYEKGSLLAIAEIRKSLYTMSKQGSSPAQKQFLDLVKETAKKNERIIREVKNKTPRIK